MKIYQVIITDEWNNNYLQGFYKDLDDAIPEINNFIASYGDGKFQLKKGDVREYPSTFNACFDVCVGDIFYNDTESEGDADLEEISGIYIRGFILDSEEVMDTIKALEAK